MNSTRQLLGRWHTAVAPGAGRPQRARVVARPALETQRLPMGLPSIATIAQNLDVDENVPMQGLRDVQVCLVVVHGVRVAGACALSSPAVHALCNVKYPHVTCVGCLQCRAHIRNACMHHHVHT